MSTSSGTESQVMRLLSGMRVICAKAFGDQPELKYDKESTQQLRAMAKLVQPIRPRYTHPVDLGGEDGVWMSIVRERRKYEDAPNTNTKKAEVIRNHAIFLERHDALSRSDCESKYDMRKQQYFRVYDADGHLQTQPRVSHRLDACLVGEGGPVRRNYLDPKDPRKKGKWSDTVETWPLRVEMLADKNVPWLRDTVTVGYLCSVRVRRDYCLCMEALGRMGQIPEGKSWTAVSQRTPGTGKLVPLKPTTIAGIVKKRAAAGGLNVMKREDTSVHDQNDTLAGHFLRGHAGSVAYTLATTAGATWDPLLGVDRARHTFESFVRSYSRGAAPRLIAAFNAHKKKAQLRFEEGSRL